MQCYIKEEILFKKGILDEVIDAVYIITMENSYERHKSIKNQLKEYNLCKKNIIFFNKGFKKCEKELCTYPKKQKCKQIKVSYEDLTHANELIFKESLSNNFSNILVLEDDFILSEKFYKKNIIEDLKNIVKIYENQNKNLALRLGCIPILSISSKYENFSKAFVAIGTHAVLYNKKALQFFLNSKRMSDDIDLNASLLFLNEQLYYNEPLIYQLFPETENRNNWGKEYSDLLSGIFRFLIIIIFEKLNLHKKEEPGYSYIYKYHNYFLIFFIIILLLLLVLFIRTLVKIFYFVETIYHQIFHFYPFV